MSANLLNQLGKKIKRVFAVHLIFFRNSFNKFKNIEPRMQDSTYHMTLKSHFISEFRTKTSILALERDVFWTSTHNVTT